MADSIRAVIRTTLAEQLAAAGRSIEGISDDQDLLMTGVLDSFGYLDFIGAVEETLGVEIDIAELNEEAMTSVSGLAGEIKTITG